jgi:hypothetical protein
VSIIVERDGAGSYYFKVTPDDHEHWDDGFDQCGTCGADTGPTDGREYAVLREDGWHIATFDGECFAVTSDWQSGDRWLPEWVERRVLLPARDDE